MIVAAKDAAHLLPEQLDALVAQDWDGEWEIVVADNGSRDDTVAVVERYRADHPRVRLVDASDGSGAGHARNRAMEEATGASFAFCDADDVVEPGWVGAIGEGLRRHDAVAGRIWVDSLNPDWLQTAYYDEVPEGAESYFGIFPFTATCNLGVRRSVTETIGGFDQEWRTGQDMEFCLRMWLADISLTYLGQAGVQYRYRPTIGALWRRSRQYGAVAPAIAARLASVGRATPARAAGWRQWAWLLRRLAVVRTRAGRARWVVVAGTRVGRLEGSVRARFLLL